MSTSRLHLHSMLVHTVAALVPLASVAWVLGTTRVSIGRFSPELWSPLAIASLMIVLLVAAPATVTGIGDRNRMYARWHRTHKKKLVLSLVLMAVLVIELAAMLGGRVPTPVVSWLGFLIIIVNNLVAFWLGAMGFKISFGRQGVGRSSYVPDMFKKPPIDIIDVNAAALADLPRTIDPSAEE